MRDFLRFQPSNVRSVNVIKEVADYLLVIYAHVDGEAIDLAIQVVESLNEFSMGNVDNQLVLFDAKGWVLPYP